MKDKYRLSEQVIREALYPTWFRWKGLFGVMDVYLEYNFISHMVQMKVIKSIKNTVGDEALYPTWFRWKAVFLEGTSLLVALYIPHGSDESVIK